jgi:hypothetical protein
MVSTLTFDSTVPWGIWPMSDRARALSPTATIPHTETEAIAILFAHNSARRSTHPTSRAARAHAHSLDDEAGRADGFAASCARYAELCGREADAHLLAAELYANAAVPACTELRFFERDFPFVGILRGEEKSSPVVSNVGDKSHRDLLTIGRGRPPLSASSLIAVA